MTRQEIVTKAVQKAIAGGWDVKKHYDYGWSFNPGSFVPSVMSELLEYDHLKETYTEELNIASVYGLIFNHDFAKALWPEIDKKSDKILRAIANDWTPRWQYHLQQMVIADDPLKYLEENT